MNANELANQLDWVCKNHIIAIGDCDFKEAAAMLRQQQVEIETMKERNLFLESIYRTIKVQTR